ncbi:hypothetical protein BDB00DRAFT_837599 [Zychaea mexicana]|uniref:uncharacterized protein n=1 Tax=Zychaea mexicana TaxID=64656 RepID=UPI0022FEA9B2|nr:uncharacterized protein BDB00DRAFT_837599 [Zychaea mexicana]KAI9490539.1 hypothetical protein BDB00DRAFT_837599 [Zychaea mexicana]
MVIIYQSLFSAGFLLSVYPLKFCDHCPVATMWNRHNNAARNIETGNLRSRPPPMRRPAGEDGNEEEEQEEQALAPVME